MTFLLTLDPGKTTGWQFSYYDDKTPLSPLVGGQIPNGVVGVCEFFVGEFYEILEHLGVPLGDVVIVSESFKVRFTYADVTPLRIEGALTALLGPDRVIYQTPAAKALVPDSRLMSIGFWVRGKRHQNDAIIHALVYMLRTKHQPTLQTYYSDSTSSSS